MPRNTRKTTLLPLLPLPPRGTRGRLASIMGFQCLQKLPRPALLERSEAREGHERHELRLHHLPLLSPLPLLLLLQLLRFSARRKETVVRSTPSAPRSEGTTRRGGSPRGVPHGAVTPLRPGNLRQRCQPLPRRWSLLSRRAKCGSCSTSSSVPGGKLLAPWSAVRGVHLAGRVVHHRCQGCSDRLLLVSPPRAQSSLPATLSSSHHGLPARLGHEKMSNSRAKQGSPNLSEPGGGDVGVCGGGGGGGGGGADQV